MRKPPKMSGTPKAVYDKVDGPIYFVKGGKVYRKGYADGGNVSADDDLNNLTPDQRLKYNALINPQDKAAFLDNIGGIVNGVKSGAGIAKIAPAITGTAASLLDASRGNSTANTTLNETAQGALGMAGQGASIGSVFGPEGTAIGAGAGVLIGGVEGFLKGRKDQKNMDATALANKNAAALAEKQSRDAAAKANMNPWDVGYADGGGVKSKKEITDNLINAGKYIQSANDDVLNPYARKQLGLKDDQPIPANYAIPGNVVDSLVAPKYGNYRNSIQTLYNHAKTLPETPYTKSITDLYGGNEGDTPLNNIAWGDKMRNIKLPYYGDAVPAIDATPNAKQKTIIPTNDAPILGLKNGGPTPAKAAEILHDGTVHGHPITDKQRKYFGWLSNKMAKGGTVNFANEEKYKKWLAYGHIHHKFSGKEKISIAGKEHKVDHKVEGGKIVGAGTGKSDSIKAEVKSDSFVVPEENAEIAEELREKVLGDNKNKKAKLKQKGGEDVRLSNGEHLFTPEEVVKLEASGVDIDELAPNQEHGKGKAKGGTVSDADRIRGVNMAQSQLESIDEQIKAIENGNKQLDKQLKLPILKQQRDAAAKNVELAQDPKNYTDLGKGLGYSFTPTANAATGVIPKTPSLNTPTVTAQPKTANTNRGGIASIGKKGYEFNAPTNPPLGQDIASAEQSNADVINPAQSDITTPTAEGIKAAQDKLASQTTSPEEKSKISDYLSKAGNLLKNNANLLPGVAGIGLAAWQAKTGYDQLNKLGARPVDKIDADFAASVEQAKSDAKHGISPEERAIADKQIQANREADVANIVNAAGGSGGTALANIRGASNNANDASNRLSAESEKLRLEKQRYANNLVGQKAAMNRNLFEDKMNAFNTNQTAGANLLGAGLQNAFGALRYTGEAANENKLAKTAQGGTGYTGSTKGSKKDYLAAAGGDEAKARSLATQYGENFDSLNNF